MIEMNRFISTQPFIQTAKTYQLIHFHSTAQRDLC